MEAHKGKYIRLVKYQGMFMQVNLEVEIVGVKNDASPTGMFIDTNVEWVYKQLDNMLRLLGVFVFDQCIALYGGIKGISLNEQGYSMVLARYLNGDGYLKDGNGQSFLIMASPGAFHKRYDLSETMLPLSATVVDAVIKRERTPIQKILDPKVYPVWVREVFITGQSIKEEYKLTQFEYDPLFIDLEVKQY